MIRRNASRRFTVAALACAGVAAAFASYLWLAQNTLSSRADVTVVYVGADDCVPCLAWQRDHWPAFLTSHLFGRVTFREVKAPKLSEALDDAYWPTDLRPLRDALAPPAGAPLWLVLADAKVVVTAQGLSQWERAALPAINTLVR